MIDDDIKELERIAMCGGEIEAWERVKIAALIGESLSNATAAIVLGTPDEEGDHNCDYMGCASTGAHVVYRKGHVYGG